MKIAASSICWARDALPGVLEKARAAGFEAIELLTMPPEIWDLHGDLRSINPAGLARDLDEAGLTLAALHLGAIMTSTEQQRRVLTDYARRAIDVAVETGCRVIVEGGPDRAGEPVEPFMRSLEELSVALENTPVRIGLENHHLNWIQFIQDYEWIFSRITTPSIGITIDTGHFTSAGVPPADVARRFPGRTYHVHVKDHVGTQSVPLGEGRTDNFALARVLEEQGYSGYLSQELEVADHADADRYAAEGIDYMRQLAAV